MQCFLIQPIHQDGIDILRSAGLDVRVASSSDMAVVSAEIGDASAVITRNAGLDRAAMDAARGLKVVGIHGTGYDRVDVRHADAIGLPIVNTPGANVQSVAEHAIAQILGVAKRVRDGDAAVREGRFAYRYVGDFVEINGKTLGIVGFGRIGRRVAEIAKLGFGMTVLVHSPSVPREHIIAAGFEPTDTLDALLDRVDVLSLHQRLTPDTHHQFDRERLGRLRQGAILVNTARGALVDADALIEAVETGHLLGAAMDVFDPEPLPADHPYTRCPGIVLSPHTGGATREALSRTAVEIASQVVDVLDGRKPAHLVNEALWDRRR
ncbi:hydroxyacid dehydrogenase [Methylobacterium terricola]|uniref:Hydroxyacid dehydrogenase n=1 Tax=Methylobacterium terricola TaxID=2583531 RepID=A0A5C4LJK1_9HYPH|nr:hydroxyacid dehydrogenase [Methylobacterium terricola]TNC14473.1 hydroxyacid dehydrogenase [Methylobacterium terricola]